MISDIHGWKTKPDRFRGLRPENHGRKTTTKNKTAGLKPADIQTKTDPLPSLPVCDFHFR